MPPAIRPIAPADWPAVDPIQRAAFDPSVIEDLHVFKSFASVSPSTCLLALCDDIPAGYLLAHPWIPDDLPAMNTAITAIPRGATSLFIHDLAILPARRGHGLARLLVQAALVAGKKLGLATASLIAVQGSQPFWERHGFQPRPGLTPKIEKTFRQFAAIEVLFMSRPSLEPAVEG